MNKSKFLIINGPNLNLLGKREPEIYGRETLNDLINYTESLLEQSHVEIEWFQSNIEGEIVSKIHSLLSGQYKALIINPGAFGHTSVAILDALKACSAYPVIEVHLSNTHKREDFRQRKLSAKSSTSIMEGFGRLTYFLAIYSQLIK